jgi:hypothetical protein
MSAQIIKISLLKLHSYFVALLHPRHHQHLTESNFNTDFRSKAAPGSDFISYLS